MVPSYFIVIFWKLTEASLFSSGIVKPKENLMIMSKLIRVVALNLIIFTGDLK